jgi:hypothetical protein
MVVKLIRFLSNLLTLVRLLSRAHLTWAGPYITVDYEGVVIRVGQGEMSIDTSNHMMINCNHKEDSRPNVSSVQDRRYGEKHMPRDTQRAFLHR